MYLSTVGRAIIVLEQLADGPRTPVEIAEALNVNRHASYRLLHTLAKHAMVERTESGAYALGIKAWELGTSARPHDSIIAAAKPHAAKLLEAYGESVHLAVYDKGEVLYVYKLDGEHILRTYTRVGDRAPAMRVATGKALLAFLEEDSLRRVVEDYLATNPNHPASSISEMLAEFEVARRQGYAMNVGGWDPAVGGIAAAITNPHSGLALAALGVSGPADRILKAADRLGAELSQRTNLIASQLFKLPIDTSGRYPTSVSGAAHPSG